MKTKDKDESDRKRNQPVELDDYDTRTLRPKGEPVAIIGHAKGGYAGANIRLTAAMAEQMAVGALACGDAAAVLHFRDAGTISGAFVR